MKLGTMDFPLWISLLLLVFFIFPLKSESTEDPNLEDKEDEIDNDTTTNSPEDPNDDDNEDGSDNGSTTNSTASVIAVNKTDPATTTTIQTGPDGMEMAQSGQDGVKDGQRDTDIAIKVGVPVALLGLVSLLGIIRLVSSGQLKNRMPGLGRIFGKIPEKSVSVYSANGPSSGNGTSETVVNRTYTLQSGHDNKQPERKPPAGSGHDYMEQGIYLYDNPEVLSNDPDTTYQTLDDGRLDPSYTDLTRSNGHPPAMPQRKYGETAYENTFV